MAPVSRLLVLGAGPAQLGVLAAARARGLTVVAADRDPAAPGFRYADRRAIVSIEDEPATERLARAGEIDRGIAPGAHHALGLAARLAERLARAEEIDGVIAPGSDHAVGLAARLAERLGLPHAVTPESAALAASKRRQRERLAETGVPQPRSRVCRSLAEVAAAAEELGF